MKKQLTYITTALLFFFCSKAVAEIGNNPMKIKITFDNHTIIAELNDSATSKDFLQKLPLTLNMSRHQNREFYTSLKLEKKSPLQNGYNIGNIAYWTPGNSLVFFYGSGYTDSLIIMGNITLGIESLSQISDNFSAHIEVFNKE